LNARHGAGHQTTRQRRRRVGKGVLLAMAEVDFFISHAEADAAWARWVAWVIESVGYSTFLLSRDTPPDRDWNAAMVESFGRARRTVILLSPNYLRSQDAEAEWRAAFVSDPTGERRLLLPIRISNVEPVGLLASRSYVDLFSRDEVDAIATLLTAIRRDPAPTGPRPSFPGASQPPSAAFDPPALVQPTLSKGEKGTVFISYSHRDRKWLDRLLVHLKPLERAEALDVWEDSRIKPGSEWMNEIEQALRSAQIAVLLVSADFLASEFINSNELPELLEGAERRGTIIMPVIVSPSRFQHYGDLARFQAVNSPEIPLSKMQTSRREEFFVGLATAIEDTLASFRRVPFDGR
jgi:TIR domain